MTAKHPCILLFNDIHISKDNIPEFRTNWNEALDICRERGIQHIAFGGDMFHSRVSQTLDTLLAVSDALESANQAGICVTLAEGNHDLVEQEALRGYCHLYAHHPNVAVVDDYRTFNSPDCAFVLHMMSYFPESGSFTRRLETLTAEGLSEGRLNYLYIHQGVNGALAQPSDNELPVHIFKPFDKVFAGHYHNRAKIADTKIEYIGSSRQFNFGEDQQKGYTILFNDGSCEFVRNEVNIRYQVIDVPAEKVDIHLYDRIDELRADSRSRLKVRVHGQQAALAALDKQKLQNAGASKVEFVAADIETIEASESGVLEKFDSRRIRESYEEFCAHKRIEDVTFGLSYLSKIETPCGN